MGAVVVDRGPSSAIWADVKPSDYKGAELDKAVAAWESLSSQKVTIPKDLIPAPPQCKVRALENYIKSLEGVLKELDKAKELVNKYINGVKAVQAAGNKAATDIAKLSTAKGVSEEAKQKYAMAARSALNIASSVAGELKNYQ